VLFRVDKILGNILCESGSGRRAAVRVLPDDEARRTPREAAAGSTPWPAWTWRAYDAFQLADAARAAFTAISPKVSEHSSLHVCRLQMLFCLSTYLSILSQHIPQHTRQVQSVVVSHMVTTDHRKASAVQRCMATLLRPLRCRARAAGRRWRCPSGWLPTCRWTILRGMTDQRCTANHARPSLLQGACGETPLALSIWLAANLPLLNMLRGITDQRCTAKCVHSPYSQGPCGADQ
jgi:hypothetical protein